MCDDKPNDKPNDKSNDKPDDPNWLVGKAVEGER